MMGIEHDVAQLLTQRKLRLAVTEATCGGLISARITRVPGSSKFFDRGVVAYSKQSKMDLLGLTEEQLTRDGSVSKETAVAMAQAVRVHSKVDLGLAETGIAGPIKGRSPKPVGTCYLAIADSTGTYVEERVFNGDRETIRHAIADRAIHLVIDAVEGRLPLR